MYNHIFNYKKTNIQQTNNNNKKKLNNKKLKYFDS